MNPQDDDPEARIRALEQPLADRARATELGTTPSTSSGNAYLPPPLPPMPPQARGPYTPPGYSAPWAPPPRKTSAGIPWVVLGLGAFVFMAVAGGVGWFIVNKSTREFPNVPGISIPSIPPTAPGGGGPANTVTTAPSGGQISVAGVSENKTIACNDSHVSVSGVSNTVTISTRHSGAHSATPLLPWSATATSSGRWFQSSAEPSPQSRPTNPSRTSARTGMVTEDLTTAMK